MYCHVLYMYCMRLVRNVEFNEFLNNTEKSEGRRGFRGKAGIVTSSCDVVTIGSPKIGGKAVKYQNFLSVFFLPKSGRGNQQWSSF